MSNPIDEFYAYAEKFRGLEAIMRMQAVKRWHMIEATRTQTLAEHSINVALLAYHIAYTVPDHIFKVDLSFVMAALTHDMPESFTGDIPTYTKARIAGIKELEEDVMPVDFADYMISADARMLIKLCDIADGIRFIRLHGVDLTAKHAQKGLEQRLEKKYDEAKFDLHWPHTVFKHVITCLTFYAYENS